MPESVLTQGSLFLLYSAAGGCFGLLFYIFDLPRRLFPKLRWLSVLQDILFWLTVTLVIYVMNYNYTDGQIFGYTLLALLLGAALVNLPVLWLRKKRIGKKSLKKRCTLDSKKDCE